MHELSIAGAVVDTALRHAGGRRVRVVNLRVGALRMVVPESLEFYFEIVARDTLCEGAELTCERVAALLRCPVCGHEWDPAPPPLADHSLAPGVDPLIPYFRCPACEGPRSEVVAGDELEVESLEVEDGAAEAAPAAGAAGA